LYLRHKTFLATSCMSRTKQKYCRNHQNIIKKNVLNKIDIICWNLQKNNPISFIKTLKDNSVRYTNNIERNNFRSDKKENNQLLYYFYYFFSVKSSFHLINFFPSQKCPNDKCNLFNKIFFRKRWLWELL